MSKFQYNVRHSREAGIQSRKLHRFALDPRLREGDG
jgi:hypothetical protein